jgi:hypothetical protein
MENSLRPVILFFHGGGFQGDNSEFPNMMQTTQFLDREAGWFLLSTTGSCKILGMGPCKCGSIPGVNSPYHTFGGSAGGMLSLILG